MCVCTLLLVARIKTKLTPRSLTVHEGKSATLTCRAIGRHVDEIRWFKDRQPLMQTEHISFVTVRYCT